MAASGAVLVVALALIALIWIVTGRTVQEQNAEIRDRAEQTLVGQAATTAETISHELLLIDQSLSVIQAAWKNDSDSVNLEGWQKQFPALLSVADDIFIADDKHVIRQDISPKAVGQGVGSAYVTFPHGSLEQYQSDGTKGNDSFLIEGDAGGAPIEARQFLMYVVRPLDHPKGWLIGASYRSKELTKLFADAALGYNSLVALVDTRRGVVQAVVGPAARRPVTNLSKSSFLNIISRSDSGTWLGETALDDVRRLHAFHRVPNRDMAVIVAANWDEVMAPAASLAAGDHALALAASALVLAIGGAVFGALYTFRGRRRQKRVLDRNKTELQRLRGEETNLTTRAALSAARLQALLAGVTDGVALFDSGLRLMQWNHSFQRAAGTELRKDMALDSMLRQQAALGLFGPLEDAETEIARRAGLLRDGLGEGLAQPGPDGETLLLHALPVTEGGLILILNGFVRWEPAPPPSPAVQNDPLPLEPAATVAAPVEW